MTRKKVNLVWIANDSARKASLKKRRLGLLKKVSELITLCGVEAFMIIYSPEEAEPMTWPPSRFDVERLIARYMSMPEMERYKKLMNQESYLKERSGKVQEQSKRSRQKNKDSELSFLMSQAHQGNGFDQFEVIELHGLDWLMKDKIKDLRKRIEYFQMVPPLNEPRSRSEDVDVVVAGEGEKGGGEEEKKGGEGVGGGGSGVLQGKTIQNPDEPMSWDQWFLDMVHNTEANVGGDTSNFSTRGRSEIGFQNSPYGFQPNPYGPVDTGYDQLHGNIGSAGMMIHPPPFELGGDGFRQFPYDDMISGGNPFGLGFPPFTFPSPYHGNSGVGNGGADMGMPGFFGGGDGGGLGTFAPPLPYHGSNGGGNAGADMGMLGFYGGGDGGGPGTFAPLLPYHGSSGDGNGGADMGMHGFYGGGDGGGPIISTPPAPYHGSIGGSNGGPRPSAFGGGFRPHGDGVSDQTGMSNYKVNNPHWPNNP